jgi:hypothetical protein
MAEIEHEYDLTDLASFFNENKDVPFQLDSEVVRSVIESYCSDDWKMYAVESVEDLFKTGQKYKRNLVYADKNVEIFILCWAPGGRNQDSRPPGQRLFDESFEGESF